MVKPKQKPTGEGDATRGLIRQGRQGHTEGREEQTMNAAGGGGGGSRKLRARAFLPSGLALSPNSSAPLSRSFTFSRFLLSHLKMKHRTEIYEVKDDLYPLFPFQPSMAWYIDIKNRNIYAYIIYIQHITKPYVCFP